MYKNSRGFTLIELLVVIAIIGILASVVYTAVQTARVKARDARRISDLKEISTAAELYNNNVGHYPVSTSWISDCDAGGNNWISDNGSYTWNTPYIPIMPRDPIEKCIRPYVPLSTTQSHEYLYWSDGSSFQVAGKLENAADYPGGNSQLAYFNGSSFADNSRTTFGLTLAALGSNPAASSPISMTATFSQVVQSPGLTQSNVQVTNGIISSFYTTDSMTYNFQVNPLSEGTVSVTIPAGVVQDTAADPNAAANLSIVYDTTPRPVLTPDPLPGSVSGVFTVTANFGEAVINFTPSDVAVTNGTASNVAFHIGSLGPLTNYYYYTFDVTPSQAGAVTVQIPAGVVTTTSNPPKSNTASNILSTTYAP